MLDFWENRENSQKIVGGGNRPLCPLPCSTGPVCTQFIPTSYQLLSLTNLYCPLYPFMTTMTQILLSLLPILFHNILPTYVTQQKFLLSNFELIPHSRSDLIFFHIYHYEMWSEAEYGPISRFDCKNSQEFSECCFLKIFNLN